MTIEIVNVSKSYVTLDRRHTVFSNINLTIPTGVNLGLIGPNGCGKSTLLRLMAGAETPDTGYIRTDQRVSWPVGFSGSVDVNQTGESNARFCARLYGADQKEVIRFVTQFSGIGEFMSWPVKTYSKGMRARFSFALSMAIEFDCLLIDEVMGVGDVDFRAKCTAALEQRRKSANLVLVTHNLKEVMRLCNRVAIMGGDEVIVSDDVTGLVKYYAATFRKHADIEDL